jgi:hypothetical protein
MSMSSSLVSLTRWITHACLEHSRRTSGADSGFPSALVFPVAVLYDDATSGSKSAVAAVALAITMINAYSIDLHTTVVPASIKPFIQRLSLGTTLSTGPHLAFHDNCVALGNAMPAASIAANISMTQPLAVIGPYCASTAVELQHRLFSMNIPLVSNGASSSALSNARTYPGFVRILPSSVTQIFTVLSWLATLSIRQLTVLYTTDNYGTTGAGDVRDWAPLFSSVSPFYRIRISRDTGVRFHCSRKNYGSSDCLRYDKLLITRTAHSDAHTNHAPARRSGLVFRPPGSCHGPWQPMCRRCSRS